MGIIRKIRRSLTRSGVLETLVLCVRNLKLVKRDTAPSQFDINYGVHTEGSVDLGDLHIDSSSDVWGIEYQPTPPAIFDKILTLLPPPEAYSFVDLGCGKGRVVLMASLRAFKCVIGVEFSRELCAIAEANLARIRPHVVAREVRIVFEDAGVFVHPAGPLVVYCYFAFTREVMIRVLALLAGREDETVFVYYNVHYHDLFAQFELLHAEAGLCIWRITRSQPRIEAAYQPTDRLRPETR
jgi:SAM-dependent methyltransferase